MVTFRDKKFLLIGDVHTSASTCYQTPLLPEVLMKNIGHSRDLIDIFIERGHVYKIGTGPKRKSIIPRKYGDNTITRFLGKVQNCIYDRSVCEYQNIRA